ncbi:hypothetical protein TNCV_728341 [Trichonephila clavipes]|nr:hypothetical protein TNCV_728341 [Trichonephila clavipes]
MCSTCPPSQKITHYRRVTNSATTECRISSCIHDSPRPDRIFLFHEIGWMGTIQPGFSISPRPKVCSCQIWRPRRLWKLALFANDSFFLERLYQEFLEHEACNGELDLDQ